MQVNYTNDHAIKYHRLWSCQGNANALGIAMAKVNESLKAAIFFLSLPLKLYLDIES